MADTQARVVDSERSVTIAKFGAEAAIEGARGQATSKKINAEADANVITIVGNAEASKTLAVGTSEADVIKLKIDSMESGNYALVQVVQALAANKVQLVPQIVAGGGGAGGQGGTLVDVLLANLIRDNMKLGGSAPAAPADEKK
jgi:regulator of protease activity HflC (stomatin/prohibitin superfamily)